MRQLLTVLLLTLTPIIARGDPSLLVNARASTPSLLTDIRYAGNNNFMGRPVAGYEASLCLLSEAASMALGRAQELALNRNLSLLVYDCYRPQRAVDDFVDWVSGTAPEPTKPAYYPSLERSLSLIHI